MCLFSLKKEQFHLRKVLPLYPRTSLSQREDSLRADNGADKVILQEVVLDRDATVVGRWWPCLGVHGLKRKEMARGELGTSQEPTPPCKKQCMKSNGNLEKVAMNIREREHLWLELKV